jgi:hypothetical protein
MFIFAKEDFEINPFLERDLRNIFKIINKNKEKNKESIYDLKYYYFFFYNLYLEKKLILPLFYLNDKDENKDENTDEIIKEEEKIEDDKNIVISFNSLYNRYNTEIFNDNNINLIYNTLIYDLKDNEINIDISTENQIKNQIIFYHLIKKYLKCNKITFLIMTELL